MDIKFCKAAIHEIDTSGNKSTIPGEAVIIKLGDQAELCFFQGNKENPGYYVLKRRMNHKPVGIAGVSSHWGSWKNQTFESGDIVNIVFEE